MITINLDDQEQLGFQKVESGVNIHEPIGYIYSTIIECLRTAGSSIMLCPFTNGSQAGLFEKGVFYELWPIEYSACISAISIFLQRHFEIDGSSITERKPIGCKKCKILFKSRSYDAVIVCIFTIRGKFIQIIFDGDPTYLGWLDQSSHSS